MRDQFSTSSRTIGDQRSVGYPDSALCVAAMELARDHSPPFLFNHVMRSFAFGRAAATMQGTRYDAEMLFLGAMMHGLGLVEPFIGEDRFEIDGADAAADFLSRRGYPDAKIAVVWDAIALHTTLAIPRRKQPEIALVQLGAGIDVGAIPLSLVTPKSVGIILADYPRLGFKEAMLTAMGAVARRKPITGPVDLMGEIGRRREALPIPDCCDIVLHAEFAE